MSTRTGDRCLAFHFTPDYLEAIVAAVPGARRTGVHAPAPAAAARAHAADRRGRSRARRRRRRRARGACAAPRRCGRGGARRQRPRAGGGRAGATSGASPRATPDRGGRARRRSRSPTSRARRQRARIISCAYSAQVVGMTPHQYRAAHAPPPRRRAPAPVGRDDLGNRLRRRLQRPVDLQPALPPPDGASPGAYRARGRRGAP